MSVLIMTNFQMLNVIAFLLLVAQGITFSSLYNKDKSSIKLRQDDQHWKMKILIRYNSTQQF